MKQQATPGLARSDATEMGGRSPAPSAFHTARVEIVHLLVARASGQGGAASHDEEFDISGDTGRPVDHPAGGADHHELLARENRRTNSTPGAERGHQRRRGPCGTMQRRAVALGIALLITNLAISTPASAHYVQPPGEEEAAAAVVQVQVSYNYAVDLPGKGGEAGLFAATVAGPRGTGAVVSSSGAVLTGRSTAMPDRGEQRARRSQSGLQHSLQALLVGGAAGAAATRD